MSAYGLIEMLIIGGAVLLSAWALLGRLAPGLRARLLGRRPAAATKGCGSGCTSCGGCETPRQAIEQPVRFHPR